MKSQHLLFIEIAGHAMRGIAYAAKQQGHIVTGLDEKAVPPGSDWLDEQGIPWTRRPDPTLLDGIDKVIISGATPKDYGLLHIAKKRGIPIVSFAEYLGHFTIGKHVITVSGTHGKTTTTSLITWLLEAAGQSPDYLIGIRPFNFPSSARLTGADTFVVEGDEYKASNLDLRSKVEHYHPDVMVLTSVEHDHPDVFPDLAAVIQRFQSVVSHIPEDGQLILWGESPTVDRAAEPARCSIITYGLNNGDFTPRNIAYQPTGIEFDIENRFGLLGRIALPLYGKHNVLNALAAIMVAMGEGLTVEQIIDYATEFRGAFRRFNLLTEPEDTVTVIDDYAHHPTEVATTLEAARLHFKGRRIVAVYRPHTYSRTEALLEEYRRSFGSADLVYMAGIEGSREQGHPHTISSNDIVEALPMPALYAPDRDELLRRVILDSRPGDVVVCMSVSGYDGMANELADKLVAKHTKTTKPATHEGGGHPIGSGL